MPTFSRSQKLISIAAVAAAATGAGVAVADPFSSSKLPPEVSRTVTGTTVQSVEAPPADANDRLQKRLSAAKALPGQFSFIKTSAIAEKDLPSAAANGLSRAADLSARSGGNGASAGTFRVNERPASQALYVTTTSNGFVCNAGVTGSGGCLDATEFAKGYFVGADECPKDLPGKIYVYGLVPNSVDLVQVRTAGGQTVDVKPTGNYWSLTADTQPRAAIPVDFTIQSRGEAAAPRPLPLSPDVGTRCG